MCLQKKMSVHVNNNAFESKIIRFNEILAIFGLSQLIEAFYYIDEKTLIWCRNLQNRTFSGRAWVIILQSKNKN